MRADRAAALAGVVICWTFAVVPAWAVDTVAVRPDAQAIDLTDALEVQHAPPGTYGRMRISTAPDAERGVRPIEVHARDSSRSWALFALSNNGDEEIERLLVVPHYRMVGSGILRPDLGGTRIVGIRPSNGDMPERRADTGADIFRLVLEPGAVTTFAAEMRADNLPQAHLWQPDAYQERSSSLALYRGILVGAAGLLALMLTVLFVARGGRRLAAGAALGWAVLVYLGTDLGLWGRLLDLSDGGDRFARAASEALLAAAFAALMFACLERPPSHHRRIAAACLSAFAVLAAVALFDPPTASGLARVALGVVAVAGLAFLIRAAVREVAGAMALIPNWFLLSAWTLAAGFAASGALAGDIVAPALLGGLVLITLLIGLTMIVQPET